VAGEKAEKAATKEKKPKAKKADDSARLRPRRSPVFMKGIDSYSRSATYSRKTMYKGKYLAAKARIEKKKKKGYLICHKPVGGDKNGNTQILSTEDVPQKLMNHSGKTPSVCITHQKFVIATSTKIDISGVRIPKHHVSDADFKKKLHKPQYREGGLFHTEQEKCEVTEQCMVYQEAVDWQILSKKSKLSLNSRATSVFVLTNRIILTN
ncbi:60S ribosomal protein L6, partial [Galemys pyrenaicus]